MIDLDDDCQAVAAELVNRGRDEELVIASLQSSLPVMQAVAAALTALADRRADKPRRRSRTIRAVYDDDGVAIGTEDVEPAPAAEGVEATPRIEGEPAPRPEPAPSGGFADLFGSIEGA
jgi:hypothetical protein